MSGVVMVTCKGLLSGAALLLFARIWGVIGFVVWTCLWSATWGAWWIGHFVRHELLDTRPASSSRQRETVVWLVRIFTLPLWWLVLPFGLKILHLRARRWVIGLVPTPTGQGYWLLLACNEVIAFGDAWRHSIPEGGAVLSELKTSPEILVEPNGRIGPSSSLGEGLDNYDPETYGPVVFALLAPSGDGCWLVTSGGAVFAIGDAPHYGDASLQAAQFRLSWRRGGASSSGIIVMSDCASFFSTASSVSAS